MENVASVKSKILLAELNKIDVKSSRWTLRQITQPRVKGRPATGGTAKFIS